MKLKLVFSVGLGPSELPCLNTAQVTLNFKMLRLGGDAAEGWLDVESNRLMDLGDAQLCSCKRKESLDNVFECDFNVENAVATLQVHCTGSWSTSTVSFV